MLVRSLRQIVIIVIAFGLITPVIWLLQNSGERSQDLLPLSPHVHGDNDNFDLKAYGKPVTELFSVSTHNRKYFVIATGEYESYNPSILAHPNKEDTWFVIAQQERTDVPNTVWFAQLVCEAKFRKGKLVCTKSPLLLPIGVTAADTDYANCKEDLAFLAFNVGPHDARAFYGPENPYAVYGSQSQYNCFGIWIQDLRMLTDWGVVPASPKDPKHPFRGATELQRPKPFGAVEKNWFMFWDSAGRMYAHYDISPKRAFAEVSANGIAGGDLAPAAADKDSKCLDQYMPKLPEVLESIHQATNSLSITMCNRSDPTCEPNDDNTFIMTIFHHKTFYNWHGEYEPYVMLFRRTAPFEIHGISTRPLWIHGRGNLPRPKDVRPDHPWTNTQMFYVTSISWKGFGQKYHGYLDDVMYLGFGIEDRVAAAIDVLAGDVVQNMGLCSSISDSTTNSETEPEKVEEKTESEPENTFETTESQPELVPEEREPEEQVPETTENQTTESREEPEKEPGSEPPSEMSRRRRRR